MVKFFPFRLVNGEPDRIYARIINANDIIHNCATKSFSQKISKMLSIDVIIVLLLFNSVGVLTFTFFNLLLANGNESLILKFALCILNAQKSPCKKRKAKKRMC